MELKIGDKVMWRGGWGEMPAREAVVSQIEETAQPFVKHGKKVTSTTWGRVQQNRVVISLTNGHWAYGNQISPFVETDSTLTASDSD